MATQFASKVMITLGFAEVVVDRKTRKEVKKAIAEVGRV